MDADMIEKLADSAQERADRCHIQYQQFLTLVDDLRGRNLSIEALAARKEANRSLNDYFYWIGHANAYRGVLAGLTIQKMVEEEKEEEGSCP